MKKTCDNCGEGYDCERGIYWPVYYPLHNADPDCIHEIVILWSGYKCAKCPGWFCL